MRTAIFGAAVLAVSAFASPLAAQDTADERLMALADEYHDFQLAEYGLTERDDGGTEQGDRLWSVTPEAHRARAAQFARYLERLENINSSDLSPEARTNAMVLRTLLESDIGDARFAEWEMPFDSDSNFWSYLAARSAFNTVEDYENYIGRMRDLPRYFDEQIANAGAGLERGFSVPRVTLEGRDASIEAYVVDSPEESPFWTPFESLPQRFSAEDRARLVAEGRAAIEESVTPAYRELLTFFREIYLPNARTTLGAREFPDGAAYYAQQIRQYTTLDLTAEEIHRIGLGEVARITSEMEQAKADASFEGTLAEFISFLRTDEQFVADTPDELMGVAAYTAKRVDDKLDEYFGFLPRYRHGLRPVDPAIAPFYTAGRGGLEYCQINTHDLPSRPVYNIPALTMHECAPGHSFQAAIALEREDAPRFRRQTYFSGFGEGWGLYTEYLGNEMGIYRDPYERFGQLSYEMWRAARLVIDTGIHHYGWTREQAVEYLSSHTALSDREVGTEIDRYISWPGQALAYKLGEMTIRRVRQKAENALGEDFDIRKFHDVVLSLGSVPLPALEARIDAFIADGGQGLPGVSYD
ncbi:DUF885 domain-containing protein [Qipengyuania huizhouensis]|uniref:DUF885 domain-containing protein n=1 Tax=Qipengyuania huizhouensis TaxID=2867245 RepID=UPI0017A33941|nr:DUF885 family protein [Qipengyuania huizhouensis]MBA4764741.1 DUF885 family protein [Erythrobacter sp.]MBX7460496.1 DUF885 family protein [Qipengyuania huizhouensis]